MQTNLLPLSLNIAFVFSSSSGGIKIDRKRLKIIVQIFFSSADKFFKPAVSPVGIKASCDVFFTSTSFTNLLLPCAAAMASGVIFFTISVNSGIALTAFKSIGKSFDFSDDTYRPSVLGYEISLCFS